MVYFDQFLDSQKFIILLIFVIEKWLFEAIFQKLYKTVNIYFNFSCEPLYLQFLEVPKFLTKEEPYIL